MYLHQRNIAKNNLIETPKTFSVFLAFAMKYLAKQRDIIITTTDKGSAVVNMDIKNYIKETNRQLSEKQKTKTK